MAGNGLGWPGVAGGGRGWPGEWSVMTGDDQSGRGLPGWPGVAGGMVGDDRG